tara:strand:- start:26 stop:1309 length:1284 start_codon:yes stop_codon:yes gene_type:complete
MTSLRSGGKIGLMKKKEILEVYCIGSIPVDSGNLYFYDLNDHKKSLKFSEKNLAKNFKSKKNITSSLNISCFADGAYPCYVVVNQFKHVKKIFVELNNTCGWGSSLFEEKEQRKQKLESELKVKEKTPDDYQIDMVVSARVSVEFGSGHRLTYTPWTHFNFIKSDKEFLKIKKSKKTKLCDLNIKSNFLIFDDYPDMKSKEKKQIIKKSAGIKDGLDNYPTEIGQRIVFCLENKKYPIYIYNVDRSQEQKLSDINNFNNMGLPNPYFPILSIENIEGCKLDKSHDGKLEFNRINKGLTNPSDFFWFQVDDINENPENKLKELKICQLDFFDFTSLDIFKHIIDFNRKMPKILFLRHLQHINDWSGLFEISNIKTIKFDNCKINPESKKKNGWLDCILRMTYGRKKIEDLNRKYGDLKVFVNGSEIKF